MAELTASPQAVPGLGTRGTSIALALAVCGIGGVVILLGWIGRIDGVTRILPGFVAMVPATAGMLVVLGLSLLLWWYRHRDGRHRSTDRASMILAAIAAAWAVAELVAMVTSGRDLGSFAFTLTPGAAMAPGTAILSLLAAGCLLLVGRCKARVPFQVAATAGLLLALVALLGYLFDAEALYEVFVFSAMALHTALAFALLFVALLLAFPDDGWVALLLAEGRGSRSARRTLLLTTLSPVILCLIALWLTEAGIFNENFRLSLLAILLIAKADAAVLWMAHVENRVEREQAAALREVQRASEDRALLLREVYHRVKNNLQQISALLRFEARRIDDPRLNESYAAMERRIRSIGLVHQMLIASHAPSEVELAQFLGQLARSLATSYGLPERGIRLDVRVDPLVVHLDVAISLGLLSNELVVNAIEHAFPEDRGGRVVLTCSDDDDRLVLAIEDDGVGWTGGAFDGPGGSTGSLLIRTMTRQLEGRATISPGAEGAGTLIRIEMPSDIDERKRYG
ncbi:sensor histidine kinase [Pseudoroseicyclus aestuarii]|nr:sensor histidine kinase [Pseudoroseicyclus aestuarii]